jgi:hypothetical protein
MKDILNMKGRYIVEALQNGECIGRWIFPNTLTIINQTIRQQMLLGTYQGALNAIQIKYFAFGDGTKAPTPNDTKLENELYRKQITRISTSGLGTVTSTVSLGAQEANFLIREIGVFCGPEAKSDANTGTLLSRVAVNIDKNSNLVLNVTRQDICNIS